MSGRVRDGARTVWLATTFNDEYVRMRGWQRAAREFEHRKEFVAGGMAGYATSEYKKAAEKVGDLDADWNEVEDQVLYRSNSWNILNEPLKQLPQVRPFRPPPAVFVSLS